MRLLALALTLILAACGVGPAKKPACTTTQISPDEVVTRCP